MRRVRGIATIRSGSGPWDTAAGEEGPPDDVAGRPLPLTRWEEAPQGAQAGYSARAARP